MLAGSPLACIRCASAAFDSSSALGRPIDCPRARRASRAAARRSRPNFQLKFGQAGEDTGHHAARGVRGVDSFAQRAQDLIDLNREIAAATSTHAFERPGRNVVNAFNLPPAPAAVAMGEPAPVADAVDKCIIRSQSPTQQMVHRNAPTPLAG